MIDLVVRAERALVDGVLRPAAVVVRDGHIEAIVDAQARVAAAADVTVAASATLLPGFVDTHVHVDEPGTDWEGFASATAAAAAAGITTLVDMPLDSSPVTTTVAALEVKQAAAQGHCHVDVGFWGGVVPGNLDDLAPLAAVGVRGFKCFLTDSGNPEFGRLTREQFRRAAERIATWDGVLLVHAESQATIAAQHHPQGRAYSSFLDSRPDAAETDAVALAVDVARDTGVRMHIVHVSSAAVLPILADAKRTGVRITAETCPHYLAFAAQDIPDGGTQYAVCPPIRGGDNRERLWSALRDGTLDMVVSDHSPCTPEAKGGGDFGVAFGGISSLQLGPAVTWTHGRARGVELPQLSMWMSERPAALAGYADRGRIAVGLRADLCAFDPDAETLVDAVALAHRHPVSPYDGHILRGAVLQTWVAGRPVLQEVCQPV